MLLLVGTVLLGAVVFALRESSILAAVLAALGMTFLGIFVLVAPIESPADILGFPFRFGSSLAILGRRINLQGAARGEVALLYLICGYFFLGSIADQPGRYFHSASTLCVLMLVISLMIEPFLFAAVFLVLAAMCAVVILTSSVEPARWGSLQLLILYTLAMLVILITGWMLENIGMTTSTTSIAQRAIVLLGIGFAILLIIPPFHFWLPSSASRINFFVLVFVALLLQTAGQFFLFGFFETYSWMRDSGMIQEAMLIAGSVVFVGAAIFALAQHELEKYLAYVLIASFGFSLLTTASSLIQGNVIAMGLIASRVFFLASLALGVSYRQKMARDHHSQRGKHDRLIFASIFIGLLSIVGFPPLGEFAFRWFTLVLFSQIDRQIAVLILLGIGLLFTGVIRWILALRKEQHAEEVMPSGALSGVERGIVLAGAAISVLVGVFPQLVYPWIRSVVVHLQNIFG
jgi:formate hydrogenlyase subunit 3/multisubunit Na+/H+ antiporter MnhD subunit